jgi:hypothetical protein
MSDLCVMQFSLHKKNSSENNEIMKFNNFRQTTIHSVQLELFTAAATRQHTMPILLLWVVDPADMLLQLRPLKLD